MDPLSDTTSWSPLWYRQLWISKLHPDPKQLWIFESSALVTSEEVYVGEDPYKEGVNATQGQYWVEGVKKLEPILWKAAPFFVIHWSCLEQLAGATLDDLRCSQRAFISQILFAQQCHPSPPILNLPYSNTNSYAMPAVDLGFVWGNMEEMVWAAVAAVFNLVPQITFDEWLNRKQSALHWRRGHFELLSGTISSLILVVMARARYRSLYNASPFHSLGKCIQSVHILSGMMDGEGDGV